MTTNPPQEGFIYVATGARHLDEARASVKSLRAAMPDAHVTLFTDLQIQQSPMEFDTVLGIDQRSESFSDKILPLARSPYLKTVYLDTDTYVAEDCREIFKVLDHFDIAAAHDPWRVDYAYETLPYAFPTFNTGLIAFRSGPQMGQFVADWLDSHQRLFKPNLPDDNDQPAFRHTLFHSKLRLSVLPTEYNLRTWHPCFIGGFGRVKVIHDRNRHAPAIAQLLNSYHRPRIYGWIPPKVLLFYLFQKVDNMIRRRLKKLAALGRRVKQARSDKEPCKPAAPSHTQVPLGVRKLP
ncbi:MAG: putative nucleotide-diphospho-sugar transferase [Verrucomicrobium sp.]